MQGYETKVRGESNTATTYAIGSAWDHWRAYTLDASQHDRRVFPVVPGSNNYPHAVYVRRNIVFHCTPEQARVYRCESSAKAREVFEAIASINTTPEG